MDRQSLSGHIRRWAAPLFYKAFGLDVFKRLKWINAARFWPPEKREAWRLEQLNAILAHCWHHVPFYRTYWGDHGLSPRPLASLAELSDYPPLNKDLFRKEISQIVADNIAGIPHKMDQTGGSTGQPLRYCHDLALHALRTAFDIYGLSLAGFRFGDPVAVLGGGSLIPERQSLRNKARNALERRLCLIAAHLDKALAAEFQKKISDHGAVFLLGYPSVIADFVDLLREQGLALKGIKAVITTSEMLLPTYRTRIESALQCSVFDHYGCNDGGVAGYECSKHDGFHWNDFESILETDQNGPDGAGRLLITNLWNLSMPFIRYENGDMVALSPTRCSCRDPFPLIRSVQGRTLDVFRFNNGRSMSGVGIQHIFRGMDMRGFQVVQRSGEKVEVRILPTSRGVDANDVEFLKAMFAHHAGPE
ncbi:MAG: hypothetical protein NTW86_14620, partial [Candidatus Sumerlaeota bacterium]|nr:hypothetical protein [Candidatus Sumerlaeota bacterium]